MASQMIDTRARLGTVLVCVAIACLGGAVMLLVHPEGGLYEKGGRASLGRTNANIIARTLVMGIFAAVYLIWVIRSAFFRLAMMMTISITLVGILATRTRAALASFFLGLAGGVILGLRGSILQRILMFAVLTLCTVSGFLFVNYTGILGADYLERWQRLEGGASVRTYIWRTGIGMWLNNPTLGVGYGCFEQHYTSLALEQSRLKLGTEREAHNTYLRAICELGPIGVSAMMGIIIWMNIYSFRIRPGPEANLGFAIAVSISAMSIFSTLTHLKIFWYMIAVLIAMVRTIPEKERAALGYAGPYEEIPAVPNPYAP